jgi:MerR family transcriptional regulator, heat shock protein HspR
VKRRKGFYSISVVAKMFDVHQQTVRLYEKEGLIHPKRSSGNTRLFSEEDVDRLEEIIHLTHKVGVNLAGVEMVLKLQKKIKKLQSEMNKLFENTQGQLSDETEEYKKEIKQYSSKLLDMKEDNDEEDSSLEATVSDDWKIDYEE